LRGRPPLPTHLKLVRGNPGKRAIKPEPEPARPPDVPPAPLFLSGYALDEWHAVAPELFRLGLLTVIDTLPLAAYCEAFKRWRTSEEILAAMAARDQTTSALLVKDTDGNPRQNRLVQISARAARDMVRYASEFGLSPIARARLAGGPFGDPPGGSGKFDGLLA
jgi:P27 family predicted phage terminase small subunit